MKSALCGLCILALAQAVQIEVSPVQKVVSLLTGMLEKGKTAKHDEQVLFAASRQQCSEQETAITSALKDEEQEIGMDTATINKAGSDAGALGKKIGALAQDEDTWTSDKKSATSVREIEAADYETTHKDYSEAIDAISRAVAILKKQSHDRQQSAGSSLAQVQPAMASLLDLGLVPTSTKRAIDLFLQQGEEASALHSLEKAVPAANGYEFQSSGVVDMMEKLQDKFVDERNTLEKEEVNAKHSFGLLSADLDAQIAQAGADQIDKGTAKGAHLSIRADAIGDKNEDVTLEKVDSKTLTDLKSACSMEATDYEAKQKLRTEELLQIQKAIEVMQSGSIAGAAQKHLPALIQSRKKAASLGQLRSDSNSNTKVLGKVAEYLQAKATEFHSRVLATVAAHAAADPFAKVQKMLKDLVVRLMEEANEEASHKGWCDTELATNEHTRKTKTEDVERLTNELEGLDARIAQLTKDVVEINLEIKELDDNANKTTTFRQTEKAENEATIVDAQEGQTAVASAIKLLKDFYANATTATALVQAKRQEPLPDTWDKPYRGLSSGNTGGVVGLMEVIHSDFARLESDATSSESEAAESYRKFMEDYKIAKVQKETDVKHKNKEKQDKEGTVIDKKAELQTSEQMLSVAKSEFESLKPACLGAGQTYDERKGRRADEIESLNKALEILEGATPE